MNTVEIQQKLNDEFQTLHFAKEQFPMLTSWGTVDYSVNIHSLGCNYLSSLGQHLGFWSTSEYPVQIRKSESNNVNVRPDTAWWSKPGGEIALIGEFERYEKGQDIKFRDKARNLLEAYHALEKQPKVLLLMSWTLAGTDISGQNLAKKTPYSGFKSSDGFFVEGIEKSSVFIITTAVFYERQGLYRLGEIAL